MQCQIGRRQAKRIGEEWRVRAEVLESSGERHLVITRLVAGCAAVDGSISRRADHDQRSRLDGVVRRSRYRERVRPLLARNQGETQPKRLADWLRTKA